MTDRPRRANHARAPVGAAAFPVSALHCLAQVRFDRRRRGSPVIGVKPGGGNLQHTAQQDDGVVSPMLREKGLLHRDFLAKNTAATAARAISCCVIWCPRAVVITRSSQRSMARCSTRTWPTAMSPNLPNTAAAIRPGWCSGKTDRRRGILASGISRPREC